MQYTVVGIYLDTGQRYATTVEADTPLQAEYQAVFDADDGQLTVAAVFEGDLAPVDQDPAI